MLTNKDVEKLKEQFATKEDLKQFATKKEMNKRFNTVSENIKNFKEEIVRHFDVVAEDIKSSNKLVAEKGLMMSV